MQQAFIDHDAFQCGYCTPGQICSAVGLLAEGKAKTADEIRELMSGNICRCGAYPNIVAAIQQAMGQRWGDHDRLSLCPRRQCRGCRAAGRRASPGAKFIAGGTNLVDLMKMDVERPSKLIDITKLPLAKVEETRERRPAHRRARAQLRSRLSPADRAALSGAVERAPGRSLAAIAQHGLGRRQSPAAHALRLFLRHRRRRATNVRRAAAAPRSTASTACTRSSAPATPASPCILPTCAWRWRCWRRRFMSPVPAASVRIAFADFHRLPGDTPQRDTNLERRRAHHRGRAAAARLCGTTTRISRSATGCPMPSRWFRSRSAWSSKAARSKRRVSRSAALRTSRGAMRRPKRHCAASRPTQPTFAHAADVVAARRQRLRAQHLQDRASRAGPSCAR